ncbi:RmlC-like cupin [Aspergillus aculeatinus CBS 121060]|uniref:RmlC-like cupin n=1 Tax=Aspergillus aculeatinus CBS 121060 TaxID=1448322 RepID=A0ACD1H3I1_9EURO|nr:RmlC-like cupin [Aspergillus aculeatinus CBS 121060]RAH68327.1 RmlC-like cupin [Aspergillus aculeatinus CBS 121060]
MSVPRVTKPLENGGSYIVHRFNGEILTMPGSKGAFRMYATQKQTNNGMAVFGWDGPANEQGYHYHKITHDAFLITEGHLKIYCGQDCRILSPGDFASAPPLAIHNPMPLGPFVRALPLVSPADWVDIFRDTQDPFTGVMFPEYDTQDQNAEFERRLPKDYEEPYDTYPVEEPAVAEVKEWSEKDTVLPDGPEPYFLRYKTGPKWVLGGVTSQPFITTKQAAEGRFAISTIETSSTYQHTIFSEFLRFPKIHHVLVLLDGAIEVTLNDSTPTDMYAGEVLFIDADTAFRLRFKHPYIRFMCYVDGDGLEALIHEAGDSTKAVALPDNPSDVDETKFAAACKKLNVLRG